MRDATGASMSGAYHTVGLAASTSLILQVLSNTTYQAAGSEYCINWESMFAVVASTFFSFPLNFLSFYFGARLFLNLFFPLLLKLCRGPCPLKKLKRATYLTYLGTTYKYNSAGWPSQGDISQELGTPNFCAFAHATFHHLLLPRKPEPADSAEIEERGAGTPRETLGERREEPSKAGHT